jgi:basic membrane protein A and related proteins
VTKKRWVSWLLMVLTTLLLAVGAAACGGDDDGGGGGDGDKMKVALVTDTGGVDDRGFNEFSIKGLDKAESELDIEKRVYISKSADDYEPNLTAAAEDGHDLVVAVGFLSAPAAIKVATDFPDISFAGVDHFYGKSGDESGCDKAKTCAVPNALGMQYPSEESGYLAGVVAALTTKTGTVSTVGGIKIPPVDNWIAGYQQAVKDTKPSVKLLNAYSQDFVDPAKCKEIALDQISQGSDVVFQVAGDCGLGAIDAACEKNRTAIGVDADQSAQGKCVLVSALKPLEESVFGVIKAFVDGKFKGGTNAFYGVEQLPDAKLLTDFQKEVPQSVKDAVAKAEKGLKDGTIDPPSTLK